MNEFAIGMFLGYLLGCFAAGMYEAWQKSRGWQGLTEDELNSCYSNVEWNTLDWCPDHDQFARAVEAKLKRKNT
jgi:hypothetical protein